MHRTDCTLRERAKHRELRMREKGVRPALGQRGRKVTANLPEVEQGLATDRI